jgi:hypothetical protein
VKTTFSIPLNLLLYKFKMEPSSFPLFSLLPTELRLRIWAYAPTPRVVELEFREETTEWHAEGSMIPLLNTCREARSEAFKIVGLFPVLKCCLSRARTDEGEKC